MEVKIILKDIDEKEHEVLLLSSHDEENVSIIFSNKDEELHSKVSIEELKHALRKLKWILGKYHQ